MHDTVLDLYYQQARDHAVIVLEPGGKVTHWLAGAEAILGYSESDVLGKPLDFLFTAEDRAREQPQHELQLASTYGRAEDDRWHVRKDHSKIWVEGMLNMVRAPDGSPAGFVKIMRDRTDLRAHIDTLQNRNTALQESDGRKNVFIGTLAHELRNVISPLSNAAQLIQLHAKDDDKLEYPIRLINRQIKFVEHLVNELLDVTRAGAGKIKLDYEEVDLGSVVTRAIETCHEWLSERKQEVVTTMADAISLEADRMRLQQVLVNLISNSSKFSPNGAKIWVKCSLEGADAVIRVEDKGRGVPAALLPVIFDTFTQAEPQSNPDRPLGLGLGLSIVKSIVELHNGSVQARSEGDNQGCEFIVRLPLKRQIARTYPPS